MFPTIIEEFLNEYLRVVMAKSTSLVVSIVRNYHYTEVEVYSAQKEMIEKSFKWLEHIVTNEYKEAARSIMEIDDVYLNAYYKQIKQEIASRLSHSHFENVQIPEAQKRPLQWEDDRTGHVMSYESETTNGPLVDRYTYTLTDRIKADLQTAHTFLDLKNIVGEFIFLDVLAFYDASNNLVGIIDVDERYIEPIAEFQKDTNLDYGNRLE